jgi:uncharacterized protein
MTKAAIIHGTKGSPAGNWFPWLAAELESRGIETLVPSLPTPDGQNLNSWLQAFDAQVGTLPSESLLIGHSVGAVFALRLLERVKNPVGTAVIVAGFTGKLGLPEYDALNSSFVFGAFNWPVIRRNSKRIICLAGDNDPYVPTEQGKEIAEGLGAKLIVIPGGGHLNAEFGYTNFPRLLDELDGLGVFAE